MAQTGGSFLIYQPLNPTKSVRGSGRMSAITSEWLVFSDYSSSSVAPQVSLSTGLFDDRW